MARYGEAAVAATLLVQERRAGSPVEAWELAMRRVYPASESSRKKGCPRSTYLGLCEAGFVRGIPRGDYTQSEDNKRYAIDAVRLLRRDPNLAEPSASAGGAARLWAAVMKGDPKRPNGQMEVVLALWNTGLISEGV